MKLNYKMKISTALLALISGIAAARANDSTFDKKFSFQDESGKVVEIGNWKGEDLVVGFAYTSCRVTCPMVVRQLKSIQKIMDEKKINGEILFITIDPETDTVAKLSAFKKERELSSPRWHFLRADEKTTHSFANLLGFGYNFSDEHIWHDRKVIVLGKDGAVRTVLNGWDADLSQLF